MRQTLVTLFLAVIVGVFCTPAPEAMADVEVLGLFKNAAYLRVNGKEKLVKVGASFQGVQVLEANSREGRIRVNGQEQSVTVSQHISTVYEQPDRHSVIIPPNGNRQYITVAKINGRSTEVLVDTGANVVAMNSITAAALGLVYRDSVPHPVSTASGQVMAYPVMLDNVVLGGIRVNHVQATVLEGRYPESVLLGMSYLQHVEMSEKSGILMLLQKY